jgi:hypothetical protein
VSGAHGLLSFSHTVLYTLPAYERLVSWHSTGHISRKLFYICRVSNAAVNSIELLAILLTTTIYKNELFSTP